MGCDRFLFLAGAGCCHHHGPLLWRHDGFVGAVVVVSVSVVRVVVRVGSFFSHGKTNSSNEVRISLPKKFVQQYCGSGHKMMEHCILQNASFQSYQFSSEWPCSCQF